MTTSVILSDTFDNFRVKTNELIDMTQVVGMDNYIKVNDTTQTTSNTTGSITTAGGVGIAKNVTIGGSVNVHGNLHANGNITSDGSLTFGDAATDNVVFAADINSHIIPNTDDTYDLGSTGQQWRNLYLDGTANLDIVDIDGAVQIDAAVTVGVNATGQDVKFFVDTASQYMLWDQSGDELVLTLDGKLSFWDAAGGENILATSDGHLEVNAGTTLDITAPTVDINASTLIQVDGEVKVGVAGTGNDVYFYGDTAAKYLLWDQSGDELALINAAKLSFWDAAGGENILATSDGHLEVNAGTTLDITAPTVDVNVSTTLNVDGVTQLTGAVTVGVDNTGHDVKFFGATSGSFMLWDESDDALELTDATPIRIGDDAAGDMTLYHDGTNSYITNKTGALKLATETSGIAVTIGHGTSEVTVADNLTVTGDLTVSGATTTVTTATIQMYDKNIEIGVVGTPSDTTADGGGLTLKGASDKTITWVNSTDSWDFNQHIFPSADDTLDLGSTTKKWQDLHIEGNINAIPVNTLATIGDVMALSIALG